MNNKNKLKQGNRQYLLLPIGYVILAAPPAFAADTTGTFMLETQPSVCVSYNRDEPCRMPLTLHWRGPNTDACVRELLRDPLLQCWQRAGEGEVEVEFSNAEDVRYQLQGQADGQPLADADVKVINRDLRSSRKRRRHVWSIL